MSELQSAKLHEALRDPTDREKKRRIKGPASCVRNVMIFQNGMHVESDWLCGTWKTTSRRSLSLER